MKQHEIAQLGHPILRSTAQPVDDIHSERCQSIISDMLSAVKAAGGVGIAAPQLHIDVRIFIICSKPNIRYPDAPLVEPQAIINPEILSYGNKIVSDWEGCLSVPSIRGLVPRSEEIKVKYLDEHGVEHTDIFSGFIARIFQHEIDHLNGLTFVDRVKSSSDLISESEWYRQYT